ncbi:MAG: hypothetical protein IPM61_04490 [Chlorobi bacterium]|nr:MAG: hypothetical protein UZ07_CHB004002268 [Chlorobi bacterium OLB7]MBK8910568.1 hypothetical protein [Chlorobiota bacterium]MBX7217439.1 hypothetical protein [Candidatus Kapabacteria bacterium]
MSRYHKTDLSNISLISIAGRHSKVSEKEWAQPLPDGGTFDQFIETLPDILVARDLKAFVRHAAESVRLGKPFILMMGAHVVKVGLAPLVCDLIERRILTGVAMNSAAAIHDTESCLFGETSEDVAATITDGTFGMSKETGEFINGTLRQAWEGEDREIGFGEALGEKLMDAGTGRPSIMATCVRLGVPITVHAAIGTDIVHQQPTMSGEATGELSFRDFRGLCHQLFQLGNGGVVMNVGSAVILPEVFLKALTVARNLGADAFHFTTANFDMIQHYRPRVNVVQRPTQDGGRGFAFTGHHEIMVPLTFAMIRAALAANGIARP